MKRLRTRSSGLTYFQHNKVEAITAVSPSHLLTSSASRLALAVSSISNISNTSANKRKPIKIYFPTGSILEYVEC